jgi:quercetin dioxygenase-like cupin family protein
MEINKALAKSISTMTTTTIRESLHNLEEMLKQMPNHVIGNNVICPLKHSFAPGIYIREIFIPKGMVIVGKIHKHEHPNFLMSGCVTVITESKGYEKLKAPLSIISPAGTKRAVIAHEDTVWITVHENKHNETDLEKLENFIIAKSFDEYDAFIAHKQREVLT